MANGWWYQILHLFICITYTFDNCCVVYVMLTTYVFHGKINNYYHYYHHHHHHHHHHHYYYHYYYCEQYPLSPLKPRFLALIEQYLPKNSDPCFRCTNHLCDSWGLTDVNSHFIPSLLPMIQNVDLSWRHRYKSPPPAIVTSHWPIVPVWFPWTPS